MKVMDTETPAVPLTLEGASVLHQMMRFRRPAWRAICFAISGFFIPIPL